MTKTFRNAYHFIPRGPSEEVEFAPSHDCYTGLSGRITCTLTLEQPTVIGGKRSHTPGHYHRLEQFCFQGAPAIPATSLKGLISSIAEAASLSRYRVLKDEALTVLLPMGRPAANAAEYSMHRKTDLGGVHDYVDKKLRPRAATNDSLSLADQMFGFVIDKATGTGSAYAGHVRPSIGTLTSPAEKAFDTGGDYRFDSESGDWVRLKELSQPMKGWPKNNATYRSATPNFYFREKGNASTDFISKAGFAAGKSEKYEIQGQKAYLHRLQSDRADSQPWKTAASVVDDQRREGNKGPAIDRKTAVQPLSKGTTFTFTLDFDNLSPAMLDLLCFALRPSAAFRHKIGYGKPLGLGSVRIDPVELVLVNRAERYGKEPDIFAQRNAAPDDLTARAARHAEWLKSKHPAALKAMLLIGETHDFGADAKSIPTQAPPVLWVPLTTEKFDTLRTDNAAQAERDSFKWFSNNDRAHAGNQRLKPIGASDTALPVLQTGPLPQGDRHNAAGQGRGQGGPPQAGGGAAPAVLHRDAEGKVTSKGPVLGWINDSISFNQASAKGMWNRLERGDSVLFDIAAGPAGQIAINIRLEDD